jgi:hypothetical protein
MKKYLHLILLLGYLQSFAQEFTATVNKNRLSVGEQFQLSFVLNASGSGFRSPSLQDFQVLGGPNQSSSMSWINGNVSQQYSYTYYLAPKREGKIVIGSASIQANGKTITSRPITLEVGKGNTQQQAQGNSRSSRQGGDDGTDMGNNLFIRSVPSKTRVYMGEIFSVTYKLYTRVNIMDNALTKMPAFNGFWSEEIKLTNNGFHTENIDGVQYQVAELKKTLLVPQQAGQMEIDPIEMEILTRIRSRAQSNDPFEQFFNSGMFGGYQDVKVKVKSKPVKVEVMNLPAAGKPAGYSGAVGDFSMECQLKPTSGKMKSNDAGNVIISISGKGNMKLLEAPKMPSMPDVEVYDPKVNDKLLTSESGISGRRSFDYLFIPRHAGTFELASVPFSFFDPAKGRYITLQTPSFHIDVAKGEGTAGNNPVISYYNNNQKSISLLGNDISYIKTKTVLVPSQRLFYGTGLYWLLCLLPFGMLGGYCAREYKKDANRKNATGLRQKKAGKLAAEKLKTAKQFMEAKQVSAFYKEVLTATSGYLSDKFGMSLSEMNREGIASHLKDHSVSEPKIQALLGLIDRCEFAQYAPGLNASMQKDYQDALEVIQQIENS